MFIELYGRSSSIQQNLSRTLVCVKPPILRLLKAQFYNIVEATNSLTKSLDMLCITESMLFIRDYQTSKLSLERANTFIKPRGKMHKHHHLSTKWHSKSSV